MAVEPFLDRRLLRRNTRNAKSRFTIPAVPSAAAMPLAHRIVDALKRCLRARGMTYGALARELRLSEASVKRLFSRHTFTLSRMEQVLRVLELDLRELARMTRGSQSEDAELSLEQETLLASDERLLSVFWLLLNGWRFADIVEAFVITRTELKLALGT